MKNALTSLLLLLFLSAGASAQTALGPGDVMFTLLNTAPNDAFAFVLLKDVAAGTSFSVTDNEYRNGAITTGEGTVTVTFSSASSCGSEYYFNSASGDGNYSGGRVNGTGSATIASTTGSMQLSTSGEGLIAFQGSSIITILQVVGFGFGTERSSSSELPATLTEGTNALAYTNSFPGSDENSRPDNVRYDCTALSSAPPPQLAMAIATNGNFQESDNAYNYGSGCGFTCAAACTDPTLSNLSANPASPCPGAGFTLNFSGTLNNAPTFELRRGSCTGTVEQTTSGNAFSVSVTQTTTFFVTALNCNGSRACVSTTVTPAVQGANAGPDQLLTSSPVTLAANNPGSGTWSIISGDGNGSLSNANSNTSTFSGTAGQAYTLRWRVTGGCPTTFDDVEVSFAAPTTNLTAGDVAFTGWNSDAPDEFSIVLLREMDAGTEILFTDKGWLAAGGFRTGEGLISLVFDRNYPCGTSFYFTRTAASGNNWEAFDAQSRNVGNITIPAVPGALPELSVVGDQLFAFQGSLNSPTLLAGIHTEGPWDADANGAPDSAQPPALTGNGTSVNISAADDNAKYNCSVTGGAPSQIRAAVNDPANWNLNNDVIFDLAASCNFVCGTCEEPVITSIGVSDDPVCTGEDVTLTVNGSLNEAARWVVYSGSCGGTEVGSSTTNDITFPPAASGTYFVAGIGGCVGIPVCTEVTINVTGTQAAITEEVIVTADGVTSTTLQPNSPGPGETATLVFSSGDGLGTITGPDGSNVYTITGTTGQAYELTYTFSSASCPSTQDEVLIVFANSTTLTVGDIAFTGINTNPTDGFSFVALTDMNAGTTITFTDRGWTNGFVASGESTMQLTLFEGLACGDALYLTEAANGSRQIADWQVLRVGTGAVAGQLTQIGSNAAFELALTGDQIFAYQGAEPQSEASGNFLAAISTNISSAGTTNEDWDDQIVSLSQDSDLPDALSGFAVLISDATGSNVTEADNGQYDCTLSGSTIPDAALINDFTNWSTRVNTAYDLSGSCIESCCTPGTISGLTATATDICPGDMTTISFTGTLNDSDEWLVSSGSCDGVFVTTLTGSGTISFDASPSTTTTYYIRATGAGPDACPATNCSEITITVGSTLAAVCRDFTVQLSADGTPAFAADSLDGGSMNSCGLPLTFSVDPAETFDCDNIPEGPRTITLTVADGTNPAVTCTSQVEVEDNIAPTFDCLDASIDLAADGTALVDDAFVFANLIGNFQDNCATGPRINVATNRNITCSDLPTFTFSFDLFDPSGNISAFCNAIITINDPTLACDGVPTAVCQDITVEIDADGNPTVGGQPFTPGDLDGGSTDDGSIDPNGFSVDITPGCANVTFPASATTITLTVTDDIGQTATCTSQVTVEDNIAPVITCNDFSVDLDDNGVASDPDLNFLLNNVLNTFADNCADGPVGQVNGSQIEFDCADIPTTTATYFFFDAFLGSGGNGTSCTVTVTVNDPNLACDGAPVAVCQDITVEIDADGNPTVGGQPFTPGDLDGGSTDDGSIDPNGFSVDITPGCANVTFPASATTITLTVTDDIGQTATCTSQVTVEDNIAPVITCNDFSVDLDDTGNFDIVSSNFLLTNVLNTFADNCAPAAGPIVSGTKFNFSCTDGPTVTATYFFFDGNFDDGANQAPCTVTVTINDPTLACDGAPVAVCQDFTVQIDADGNPVFTPSDLDGGSSDDNTPAGDLIFSIDPSETFDCADILDAPRTVTLTVTDNTGQTATCTSQVEVEDNIAPVIECQNVAIDLLDNGTFNSDQSSDFFLNNVLSSFEDNCASAPSGTATGFQFSFTCDDRGNQNETYFFGDGSSIGQGNQSSCNVVLQVNDPFGICGVKPTANCQPFSATPDANGNYTLNANSFDDGSTDDRSVYTLVFSPDKDRQENRTRDCEFTGTGQGQSFTAGQTGVIQSIRVRAGAATSTTLHLYAGNDGSGTNGVGTPAYSQAVELFYGQYGTTQNLTTMNLDVPFPVIAGQEYSFVLEGETTLTYSCTGSPDYDGGRSILDYRGFSQDDQDYTFEVNIIGPVTREFDTEGVYPINVWAVDDQGNVSSTCRTTFTLGQPLPVEWLSFTATGRQKDVLLEWTTSLEDDNAGFHVERSADGQAWTVLGEVAFSDGAQRYAFTDERPLTGDNVYRIRQTDFDGTVSWSPLETVVFTSAAGITVFPNPATDLIRIKVPEGVTELEMLDINGRVLPVTFEADGPGFRVGVSQLPAGVYLLRAMGADAGTISTKVIVRR